MSDDRTSPIEDVIARNAAVLRSMLALQPNVMRVGAYHLDRRTDARALEQAGLVTMEAYPNGLLIALTDAGRTVAGQDPQASTS